jgi:hypothetical protein
MTSFANFEFGGTLFSEIIPDFCRLCYVNLQNTAIYLKHIQFIDRIKLILYPKVINSRTHLTLTCTNKRHGVQPQNGIPGFSLHFSKELSYGYLRFEGFPISFKPKVAIAKIVWKMQKKSLVL